MKRHSSPVPADAEGSAVNRKGLTEEEALARWETTWREACAQVRDMQAHYEGEAASLRERLKLADSMAEALDDLLANQNGPPLLRHMRAWECAVQDSQEALSAYRAGGGERG